MKLASVFLKSSARSFAPLCWSDRMINLPVSMLKGTSDGYPDLPSCRHWRREDKDEKTTFFRGEDESFIASQPMGFFSSFWSIFRMGGI